MTAPHTSTSPPADELVAGFVGIACELVRMLAKEKGVTALELIDAVILAMGSDAP